MTDTEMMEAPTLRRRVWPSALAVFVVATSLDWLRLRPEYRNSVYAEDGPLFISDWALVGKPTLLWQPYAGYQHLIPRILSGIVTQLLPIEAWALATAAAACLVVGGVSALVFIFSRDVIDVLVARIGLAAIPVLAPLAGDEILGNLANVHWFLIYLTPWLLLARPRSKLGVVLMAILALSTTLTEPQCAIFLPLALWRFVQERATRPVLIVWMVGVSGQVLTTLLSPRSGESGFPPLASTVDGYLYNTVLAMGTTRPRVLAWVLVDLGWWAPSILLGAFVGLGVWSAVVGGSRIRLAAISLMLGSIATWTLSFALNNNPNLYFSKQPITQLVTVRWGSAAGMLLLALVPLAAGVLERRTTHGRMFAIAGVLAMVAVMLVGFRGYNDRGTSQWDDSVAAGRVECDQPGTGVALLAVDPDAWLIRVSCDYLH